VGTRRGSTRIPFGIDCLVEKDAIEIKWRDATTDGESASGEALPQTDEIVVVIRDHDRFFDL